MEYNLLGKTGFHVSRLGLGGAPLGGDFGGVTDKQAVDVIHRALDLGINFIDTAPLYGHGDSERRIGLALKGRRDRVILASKAVKRGEAYSYENTIRSVEQSLRRLQTDVIDLLQIHEPNAEIAEQIMQEAVPALLKLKEEGKIRAIGINGRELSLLRNFIETGLFDTTQMFSRYMLIDYSAKDELLPLTREQQIGVINGSVLGMGLLADAPPEFLLRNERVVEEAGRRIAQLDFLRKTEPRGLIEPAMRFSLSCPDIHVTLIGTTSLRSLELNAGYCDGQGLPDEELARLLALFPGQPIRWERS